MPTQPTSMLNRMEGIEAWTDPISLPSGTTIGGEIFGPSSKLIVIPAATTVLTITPALYSGTVLLLQSTGGLAITPPAATGTGNAYQFCIGTTISGGSVTIDAKAGNASDLFTGRCYQLKVGTSEIVYAAGASDNLITLTGTTTGGVKGDWIRMVDVALHQWYCWLDTTASATVATPFSSH